MKLNRYFSYLVLQILTIPAVMAIFASIPDKKVASMFASALFLGLSFGFLGYEYKQRKMESWLFWVAGLQFLTLFAIPIFLLRVTHWDQDFNDIAVGPLRAAALHKVSNVSFIVWMIANAVEGFRWRKVHAPQ